MVGVTVTSNQRWQELKIQIQHEISEAEIGQHYTTDRYFPSTVAMTAHLIADVKIKSLQKVCEIMKKLEEA